MKIAMGLIVLAVFVGGIAWVVITLRKFQARKAFEREREASFLAEILKAKPAPAGSATPAAPANPARVASPAVGAPVAPAAVAATRPAPAAVAMPGAAATGTAAPASPAAPPSLAPALAKIHRNLKQAFDPAGIFNPGRMYPDL